MQRKAAKKAHTKRFTEDGLPRDANDWTEQDWADLYRGMEAVKAKIAARHREDSDAGKPNS